VWQVTVIDYGVGNLFSVTRAFETAGATVSVSANPTDIATAEHLVLPGVGAFGDGMALLRQGDLVAPILDYAATGRPFLGICLGMQLMFEASDEFGDHPGLGLIPGTVQAIPRQGADGRPHKVPHIGWSPLLPGSGTNTETPWTDTLLDGIPTGVAAYFVHSFAAYPLDTAHRLADTDYNSLAISAVVKHGALYGCQFHPEKSGPTGLAILRNFRTQEPKES
jgi:imidazole glycerol-phosphate synthase subunit HisH